MRALLHDLLLSFESDDPQILSGWQTLFDLEIAAAAALQQAAVSDIQLDAACLSRLPQPPRVRPYYSEQPAGQHERLVRYFETTDGGLLDLARPAQIAFDYEASRAHIALTRQILDTGNLEDITMIALAPFLRRRGFYMAHAFAVCKDTAVLLSGPSGSGKTTSGLALMEAGWRYLANDVTLLHDDPGGVTAYLSPGAVNLHSHTLTLLPTYQERLTLPQAPESSGKYNLPRGALLAETRPGSPAPVSTILFPTITDQDQQSLHEIPAAIGMARLVEEGVDQWDKDTYEDHLNLLAQLSRQATFYILNLPRNSRIDLRPIS